MGSRTVIAELGGATLYADTDPGGNRNELQFDAKKSAAFDPIGLRFGSWGPGTIVKLSADLLTGDDNDLRNGPRRSERILIELRTDDHPDAEPNAGCIEVYLQADPVGQETDKGEAIVARLTRRAGLELFVPLNAYAGIPRGADGGGVPVAPLRPNTLVSPDGTMQLDIQNKDALNMTLYDMTRPDGDRAIWSVLTGWIHRPGQP